MIHSDKIPKPGGHYSACVEHNGLLYVSGQLPFIPHTNELPEGIKAQTRQVLDNIRLILEESGSKMSHILQARIYVPDVSLWGEVNSVYKDYMGDHKPARCVVPTRNLHHDSLIEMEVIAFVEA